MTVEEYQTKALDTLLEIARDEGQYMVHRLMALKIILKHQGTEDTTCKISIAPLT